VISANTGEPKTFTKMEYALITIAVLILIVQIAQLFRLAKMEKDIEILEDFAELSAMKIEELKTTTNKFDTPF